MFEVMNDIEDVPPHLLSAHRSFIMRADMTEIGDKENGKGENFSEKGGSISMFLFSDTLEVSIAKYFGLTKPVRLVFVVATIDCLVK